jgi:hypothetical protein
MLAKLGECALERRLAFVEMPFSPSGKNRPALEFLASLDAETPESANDALIYRVPSSVAARGRYVPPLADVTGEIPSKESGGAARPQPPADVLARAALLGSIAAELQDAEEIHRIVLAETRLHGKAAAPFVPAETPLEEKVAALWSEILGRPGVGRNDSFFALGGHSLLAVQVLSRMRQSFNVDLSPRLLYTTGFTVAELSQAIVAEQIRQASPTQDVDSIIRKLNELSDDEVRALLEGTKDDKQD